MLLYLPHHTRLRCMIYKEEARDRLYDPRQPQQGVEKVLIPAQKGKYKLY